MSDRNFQKERKLVQGWQYFRPTGPYTGEGAAARNIETMEDRDVEALLEAADEMAEYIDSL